MQGYARGFARTDGVLHRTPALILYVDRKRSRRRLRVDERLPRAWCSPEGRRLPVDVQPLAAVATGGTRAGNPEYSRCVRPIRPGYSFGLYRRTGTLGLVVWPHRGPPRPLLLTSSHVCTRQADGQPYPLYQPAGYDAVPDAPPVACAFRSTRLHPRRPNHSEAGLALPLDPDLVDPVHPLGPIRGIAGELHPGQRLHKVGRTTGRVEGEVTAVGWHGWIRFRHRRFPFARQVVVSGSNGPVSLDGDSGSVWITEHGEAAALSFAGCRMGLDSISTPISLIFRLFDLRLPDHPDA